MLRVIYIDKYDPTPDLPWASRLEVAELIELARRKHIEHCLANVEMPGGLAPYLRRTGIQQEPCSTTCAGGSYHAVGVGCPRSNGMGPLMGGEFWLSPTSAFIYWATRVPGRKHVGCTRRFSTTRGSLDLRENWLKHINKSPV